MPNPTKSPWGTIDNCICRAPGIFSVDTPGHGGFMLTDEALLTLPKWIWTFETYAPGFGENGIHYTCFEEDMDALLVWLALLEVSPDLVTDHTKTAIARFRKTCAESAEFRDYHVNYFEHRGVPASVILGPVS